jgi:hypothetical protein
MKTKRKVGWYSHPKRMGVFRVFSVRHAGGDVLFYCQFDEINGNQLGKPTRLDHNIWIEFDEIKVSKEKLEKIEPEDLFGVSEKEIDQRIKVGALVKVLVGTEKGRSGKVTEIYGANVVVSFDRGEVELIPIWDVKFERKV